MSNIRHIATEGSFEIYRAGHVLIVNRHGKFFCNLRKADAGYRNPVEWARRIEQVDAEEARADAERLAARRERIDAYLAERAERAARSPQFNF